MRIHNPAARFSTITAALLACSVVPARALDIDSGVPDLRLRWDNTIKYSAGYRLKDPSPALTNVNFALNSRVYLESQIGTLAPNPNTGVPPIPGEFLHRKPVLLSS